MALTAFKPGSSPVLGEDLDPEPTSAGWPLPAGRRLALPGRGTTFIRVAPGPSPEAPTLLLLHGLSATGGLNWFTSFPALAEHFRVVAIDHRGHGRGIRGAGRFRLADCADDAVAALDELGIERVIPVGYSMGGPIAQLIWHRHRPRVEALVLCATSRNFRGSVRERVQFLGLGMMVAGRLARIEPARLLRAAESALMPELGSPALREWMVRELWRNDTEAVLQAAEALGRYSSHRWIDQIDVPVSVVVPDHDQLVPVRRQLKLARSIPSAVLFPVEGDHIMCATAPEHFVPSLVDACLLAAHRAARRAGTTLASLG